MNLNLIDNSSNVYYSGNFNEVVTDIKACDRTKPYNPLLNMKEFIMSDEQTLKELKSVLSTRYNNSVEMLANAVGLPVDQVNRILSGEVPIPVDLLNKLRHEDRTSKGDYFQIGDRFEFYYSGDGVTNNYAGLLDSVGMARKKDEKISQLEREIKENHKMIADLKKTIEALKKEEEKS